MKILGREPALWGDLLNVIAMFLFAFVVHVSTNQQGAIIAAITVVVGLVVAAMVHDGLSAAILGFAKAAISIGLAFGLHWSSGQQAIVLALVATVTGMFIRTQVTAKVPPLTTPTA